MKACNKYINHVIHLVMWVLISTCICHAQVTVSGAVRDAESGESLVGATVQVKGKFVGTVTDADGTFTLDIDEKPEVLIISYTGYTSQEVVIGDRTSGIDIYMESMSYTTNEVIVTAQHREQVLQEVPMSIAVVDQSFLSRSSEMNEIEDLVGIAPGLTGKNLSTSQAKLHHSGNRY